MSEAMSSSDIENVLSSIRRLVTEDLRPRPAAAPVTTPAAPSEPAPGKLLLTPALRVVAPADRAPRPPIDGVLSLIGARVAPPPAGFEAETGDAFVAAAEIAPPRPVAAVTAAPVPVGTPRAVPPADLADSLAIGLAGPAAPASQPAAAQAVSAPMADDDMYAVPGDVPPVVDLDEETLRDLIRDVLREELQGPMGERITRNIRKLVRAELARSVALRNVD